MNRKKVSLVLVASFLLLPCMPPRAHGSPLTLQEGLSVVTSQGYDLRVARAGKAAAQVDVKAVQSRMRPRVTAYADHTWLKYQPEAIFGGGTSPLGDDRFLRYGVTVRQRITDFGRSRSGVEAAAAAALAQDDQELLVKNTASLDFIITYVSLLEAGRSFLLTEQEMESFQSHLSDAQILQEAGEVTRHDVLAAEVSLADARLRHILAGDRKDLAASALNLLVLRPLSDPVEVSDFVPVFEGTPALQEMLTHAQAFHWEARSLDRLIAAKEAELRSREAESYPDLFVSGGYAFEENSYRVHEDNWSATLGITWDLYTGGANQAARARLEQELTALVARREEARERILLQVRDAHRLLTGALQRTEVTMKAKDQAAESLRLQEARYSEGEASATDVTDAVTSLARTRENHWAAVYGRLKAEAQLLYAAGYDLPAAYNRNGGTPTDPPRNSNAGEER